MSTSLDLVPIVFDLDANDRPQSCVSANYIILSIRFDLEIHEYRPSHPES